MITDTGYIIDVFRGKNHAIEKSQKLSEDGVPQKLCAPVVYEVLTGIEFVKSRRERVKLDSMLEKFDVLSFDLKSARICGELHAELLREGEERGSIDIQIASIAIANDERLLSNDSDFDMLEELFDLELESY